MTTDLAERQTTVHPPVPPPALDAYRSELTSYCSRILGSSFEADDAVQETMLKAWRSFDRFEGRSSVKSWLYRIAINVCNDMLRARNRRPATTGAGAYTGVVAEPGVSDERVPVSRASTATVTLDPVDEAVRSESVHHAFAAALHLLPPRQRAVLILREVLRWPAADTAELLGASVASVNSALQRARATLAGGCTAAPGVGATRHGSESAGRDRDSQLVDFYAAALGRADVDGLISQLVADATGAGPGPAGSQVTSPRG